MTLTNLESEDVKYIPTNPDQWSDPDPMEVFKALDQLAQRVTNLDGAINLTPEFDVSESISSTIQTTLQNKIDFTTDQDFPPGTYKINYFFEKAISTTNKTANYVIDIDGLIIYNTDFTSAIADEYQSDTGFFYVVLTGTATRRLRMRFKCVDPSMTAYIKEAKLDIQPFGGI